MRRAKSLIGVAALLAAASIALSAAFSDRCEQVSGADLLSISTAGIKPATAKTFCYDDGGRKIRFLLARGADGKVHAVFDACRQCYAYHKGYRAADGNLVCRVCGNRYAIEHMEIGKASCVPVPLKFHEESGKVTIRVSDLTAGRDYF